MTTDLVLGPLATPEQRALVVAESGLDAPIVEQYLRWVSGVFTGDLGYSFVSDVCRGGGVRYKAAGHRDDRTRHDRGADLGIPLGFAAALHSRGIGQRRGRLISALGISLPEFLLAGLVVFIVSTLGLGLSVGGFAPFDVDPGRFFSSLVLPITVVLSIGCVAVVARNTRDAVMNVLVEPHVQAAVARGETPGFIVRHHVLRNAAAPILTVVGALVAVLLGGTVIVEFVFDVPRVWARICRPLWDVVTTRSSRAQCYSPRSSSSSRASSSISSRMRWTRACA